jgi:copper transport protein
MKAFRQNFTNKSLRAILVVALLLVFAPSFILAHAKLLKSNPADGEVLRVAPDAIELIFNTALQTASGMNSITVTDRNGQRVDRNNVTVAADGKELRIELEKLPAGVYSVEWRALSADDHPIRGKFGFEVTLGEAAAPLSETSLPPNPVTDEHAGMRHENHTPETGGTGWQSAVRWLNYLALMALFGGFAFWLLVFKPALAKVENLTESENAEVIAGSSARVTKLAIFNLMLLALSMSAALILQTSAVFNLGLTESIAPFRWQQILMETAFGLPWILQFAMLVVLSVIVFLLALEGKKSEAIRENSVLWPVGLGICALLFLTPSLSGHARAAFNEYSLAILFDWLHLLAAGFWLGGMFHLVLTMPKAVSSLDPVRRAEVQGRAISNFTAVVVPAVIIITLTGIYNSWIHLDEPADLWTTAYGTVLLLKTGLFLVMLAVGGLNSFILRPRLVRMGNSGEKNFYRSVWSEALIGVIVLLLAAILAFLPPSRRHERSDRQTDIPVRRFAWATEKLNDQDKLRQAAGQEIVRTRRKKGER